MGMPSPTRPGFLSRKEKSFCLRSSRKWGTSTLPGNKSRPSAMRASSSSTRFDNAAVPPRTPPRFRRSRSSFSSAGVGSYPPSSQTPVAWGSGLRKDLSSSPVLDAGGMSRSTTDAGLRACHDSAFSLDPTSRRMTSFALSPPANCTKRSRTASGTLLPPQITSAPSIPAGRRRSAGFGSARSGMATNRAQAESRKVCPIICRFMRDPQRDTRSAKSDRKGESGGRSRKSIPATWELTRQLS